MKNVFFILLFTSFFTSIFAKDSSTCYNVQLFSAYKNDKNIDKLLPKTYADNCKVLELESSLTLRCGCFDNMREAKQELTKYKKKFTNAYISTTYAYRFEEKKLVEEANSTVKMQVQTLIKTIEIPTKPKVIKAKIEHRDVKSYKEGMSYYKKHDFKNSYEIFSKIYLENLNDINFNFYLGQSAYETGNYENALAAFERVEMQDASNLRNRLEMARTYYMLKMYEDSENAFRDVLEDPNIPTNIRRNIELSLSRVSKVQQKSFTYASIMMDVLYDSNLNYGSLGSYQYAGGTTPAVDSISDSALEAYVNVVNIYDLGGKGGYAVKNSFSLYLKDYSNYNDYNILYLAYTPSLIYQTTKYVAELAVTLDTMELGKKKYLSSISVLPKFEYNHTNTLRSIMYFKYQRKEFQREAQKDFDADRLELSYGLQDILSPQSYIEGNIFAINENSIQGSKLNVNFDELKFNTTYVNQFTPRYALNLFAQIRDRHYQYHSSGFNNKRQDIGGYRSADLSITIIQKVRFKLRYSYEYVDSNQDRFTYQKYTVSAGIVTTF